MLSSPDSAVEHNDGRDGTRMVCGKHRQSGSPTRDTVVPAISSLWKHF
jgi:hypothetical protein